MKIIYLRVIIFILIANLISCKAQQTYPLLTSFLDIPNGAYIKDINGELNPYVGIYKANFNSNEITLFITKQEHKLEESAQKNYYTDALIVKYIVKNSTGTTLQDTQNNNTDIEFYSFKMRPANVLKVSVIF